MPGDGLAHGPPAKRKLAAVTTGSAGSPGIPCAMVLTVSFELSLGTGLSCPHHRTDRSARLDTSVGVSGPHDFAVRIGLARQARRPRPPHPAPRFVTLRNAPLWDGTAIDIMLIWVF